MTDPRAPRRVLRHANRRIDEPHRADSPGETEYLLGEVWKNIAGADAYLPVLLLIFLAVISGPLFGDSILGAIMTIVVASAAVVLTIFRSTARQRVRRTTLILVTIGTSTTIVAVLLAGVTEVGTTRLAVVIDILFLVLLLVTFPMVLLRALRHRRVTVNTVCATLAAYLLIGLIFTAIYRLIGTVAPPFFSQSGDPTPGQYSYFSFMTLTTVGYGDLTPGSDPSRGFVIIEAVLGQVFLVTTMARVISLLGEERAPRVVVRTGTDADVVGGDDESPTADAATTDAE